MSIRIEPFQIDVGEAVLSDLRQRIRRTRWPRPVPQAGWAYGADTEYLRRLLRSWAEDFDWRSKEEELNRHPHYVASVDGKKVHFIHARGKGPDSLPIILTHGWPSSFIEYLDVLPLLVDPESHGGNPEDSFDVVVASLPGYGFSDPPTGPFLEGQVADTWCRLMRDGLGYDRFGAHGSDVGSGVTIQLGIRHPQHVAGIHLSAFYLPDPPRPWSEEVEAFYRKQREVRGGDVAYSQMQATRPQTVAQGLTDSPAGLAAWILDVFRSFSDCGGDVESRFSRDHLLTNLTIYWATGSIGSSMRGYFDYSHAEPPLTAQTRVEVPAGFAVFRDSYRPHYPLPPREIADHLFDVAQWSEMPRGGHFAAIEEPHLLAADIRALFRPLRATSKVMQRDP